MKECRAPPKIPKLLLLLAGFAIFSESVATTQGIPADAFRLTAKSAK